jgi:F-type H+-transporting ATPase subunit a
MFRVDPTSADTLLQTGKSIADTVSVAGLQTAPEHAEKFEFGHLLEHINDAHEIEIPGGHIELPHFKPLEIAGMSLDLSPTKHAVFLLLAALIVCVLAIVTARRYRKNLVPSGIANMMEAFVLFIRDEVAIPNMGKGGVKYVPYLLTTFFFILTMNLIGLVPYGATATGNIAVTAGLALIAYIMIQVAALRAQGLTHYLAHFTGGVHWTLWPVMIPIEILGTFTKAFALCIRLFANMTGGHIVLISLIGLIFIFRSILIGVGSVVFAVAINMLEILVAFIQAYVFTMLTSLFMGLGMQVEHHEEHASHQ